MTSPLPDDLRLRSLMVSYQSGSLEAFDRLYALLAPAVTRLQRRHTADAARVDDLVQETFLQIHRARHTYDPRFPVMPWALAIARHVWLMHRRAASRRPQATDTLDEGMASLPPAAAGLPDRLAVRDALRQVTPERRRPLVWHHIWGWSFRDIARRLDIREDAAKLRSSRGMADMRRALGRKNEHD